jgi:hypothetical protein
MGGANRCKNAAAVTDWKERSMGPSTRARCFSVFLAAICLSVAAAAQTVHPQAAVPLMSQSPKLDGTIHETEWAGALRMAGLNAKGSVLDNRHAAFWLGCDGKTLYVAMRSELPPGGGILARVKANKDRDQVLVTHDDCIELWIDPHHGAQTGAGGDQRYFQIITNANGALYDVAFDPSKPQQKMDTAWRVDWTFASSAAGDHWDAEIGIPLRSLGATAEDLAHPWGFRMVRNWKNPNRQADWAVRGGAFDNRATMAVVNWLKQGPLVRMINLRPTDRPGTDLKLQLSNPSQVDQAVRLKINYRSAQNAERNSDQIYHLAPGASQVVELEDKTRSGDATASILATAEGGEPVYFRRSMQWSLQRPERIWTTLASAAKAVSLDFGYYPSFHKLKARLDVSGLKQAAQISGATLQIISQKTHASLAHADFPRFNQNQSELVVDLPDLQEGSYDVSAELKGRGVPTEPITRSFVRQKFEWENNTIGISDQVIPPFTPLKVEGKSVEAVLRKHDMNDAGLWDQVVSEDKPILAGPMRFEIEVGGKTQPLEAMPLKFMEEKPNRVAAQASWQAGPIHADIEEAYDYDGMMKLTLHLKQQGDQPVQKLDLAIPIRADVAELMHVISDGGTHFQYSGALPTGEGLIWESKKANHPASPGTFAPYIWIGDERQGVAWFADNDRDWLLDDKVSTQTVERQKDGTVVLKMHLVTRPGALKRERTIVFALQATPTKPMPKLPKPWRKWRFPGDGSDLLRVNILGSGYAWGNYGTSMDIYPREKDFGIYDLFRKTRQSGQIDQKAADAWLAGYHDVNATQKEMYRREVMWGMRVMKGSPAGEVVIPYTNARGTNFGPEFQTFQDEWLIRNYTSRQWPPASSHGGMSYDANVTRSYQDYCLWYLKKMLDSEAFDGLYFDDVFLQTGMNDISGSAWRDDDGTLRPGYGLFNMRQYLKRAAVLDYQERHAFLNMAHMTNTQIVPITTWAGMNLDWEMHYGMDDFQDRFSRDFIRTETIGLQSGSVPVVLGGVHGKATPQRKAFVERTQTAATVVHEIKVWASPPPIAVKVHQLMDQFGYGQPDCRVFTYWQKPFPAVLKGTDADMLILNRDGKALIFVASYGQTAQCTVTLDAKALGLKPGGTFTNLEDGKTLESAGDAAAKFELPHHDFRIMEYR